MSLFVFVSFCSGQATSEIVPDVNENVLWQTMHSPSSIPLPGWSMISLNVSRQCGHAPMLSKGQGGRLVWRFIGS